MAAITDLSTDQRARYRNNVDVAITLWQNLEAKIKRRIEETDKCPGALTPACIAEIEAAEAVQRADAIAAVELEIDPDTIMDRDDD